MKIIFNDYQPDCSKVSGVTVSADMMFAGTKFVTVSLQIEKGDNVNGYITGNIINVPGKYTYSETKEALLPESEEIINEFIRELKSR